MALEYDGALATQRGQWIATDMLTGPLSIKQKANFETSLKYLQSKVWTHTQRSVREKGREGGEREREVEKEGEWKGFHLSWPCLIRTDLKGHSPFTFVIVSLTAQPNPTVSNPSPRKTNRTRLGRRHLPLESSESNCLNSCRVPLCFWTFWKANLEITSQFETKIGGHTSTNINTHNPKVTWKAPCGQINCSDDLREHIYQK